LKTKKSIRPPVNQVNEAFSLAAPKGKAPDTFCKGAKQNLARVELWKEALAAARKSDAMRS
jgi:hypothetical protein